MRLGPQRSVDRVDFEGFGIERPSEPFPHLLVFWVAGVADRLKQVLVSRWTAAVLGWAGTAAADTAGIAGVGVRGADVLDNDLVLPAVPKVVLIGQRGAPWGQAPQSNPALI